MDKTSDSLIISFICWLLLKTMNKRHKKKKSPNTSDTTEDAENE